MKSMKSTVKRIDEEEMLKILNEEVPVGVCIMQDGKICYFNSYFPIAIGYATDELIGKDSLEIVVPEDREMVTENTIKMMKGELLSPYQFRVICKDGSIIWVMATVRSIQYHGRRAVLGNYMEITERKQVEEALRQSEERYRTILEEMGDGYFETDLAGNLTFVNDALTNFLGYSKEELIGMNYRAFTPEEDVKPLFEAYNRMYKTGELLRDFSRRIIRKDGTYGFAQSSVFPIRNDKGEIIGFRGVRHDITERKQAEEKLRQSEEKHRALFDSSVIGMFVMDAETMKIVMCNQAAVKMFGFSSAEEAIGANPLDFLPPEFRDKAREITVKELFEQDLRRTHEYRVVNKDGREGWVSLTGARIMHEGRLAGLVSIIDITERKQAVEALRQSEERYRTILEEMEDAYFEVDLGGHFTFVNNSVCRDLGYSREELIGMSYKDFTVEDDIESVFRVFNEVYRTGVPNKGFPWKTIRKDGIRGFAETSVSLLRNDKGEIIGFRGVGRDITERKQAEEKLRQSEENYKILFNSSVIGMYVLDVETMKVVIGNQAAAEMAGFSSLGEGIGINPLDFVIPEDREQVLEIAAKEFEQNLRRTHEVRVIAKDGGTGWISISSARIMHKGRLAALVAFTDITERKQMEEALSKTRAQLSSAVQMAYLGPWEYDAINDLFIFNDAFYKIFHTTAEEVGGYTMSSAEYARRFVHPEDAHLVGEEVRKALQADDPNFSGQLDHRIIYADGGVGYISVRFFIVKDETGDTVRTYGVNQDITERKQAEEALKLAAEEWKETFDSITDAISIHDRAIRFRGANKAFADIFHKKPRQIIGRHCYELHKGEKPISGCPHKQTLATKQPAAAEFYESNLGKYLHESTSPIFDGKGEVVGTVHITRDITEQKQQNERLMMADRLASIGELASGTAHELNNPLTSIIGFSQLLMEKEAPDDIREDLKLIYNEAQRAADVTKNLLTFARKHAPMKQRNQINVIIEDVLKLRAYEHKINSIEVERQLAPDLLEIMVDYFQMQQVFMNIIINAEYFMTEAHNRGTLTITTKKQNGTMRISIADDGPGIPQENLSRIFDPFFTTKEAGRGTGLGLSICHGIVAEHGGQIYARSQPGKGATIVVELPINSH